MLLMIPTTWLWEQIHIFQNIRDRDRDRKTAKSRSPEKKNPIRLHSEKIINSLVISKSTFRETTSKNIFLDGNAHLISKSQLNYLTSFFKTNLIISNNSQPFLCIWYIFQELNVFL